MSLSKHLSNHAQFTRTDALETDQVEMAAIAGDAQLVPLDESGIEPTYALQADWAFTENAENPGGEVAVNGYDFDVSDGIVYTGDAPTAVRATIQIDTDTGAGISPIAPDATDTVTMALFRNNDLIAFADEGFVAELDAEVALEWNIDTYVPVNENDVLRVALVSGSSAEAFDLEVVEGGYVTLS